MNITIEKINERGMGKDGNSFWKSRGRNIRSKSIAEHLREKFYTAKGTRRKAP